MDSSAHIVLVDDDPVMRELAEAKLLEAGYCVTTAENGRDAVDIVNEHGADMVISDLDMPIMSGFELTEVLRSNPATAEIPVIAITATDHPDSVDRVFAAGASSFLAKPINWTLFNHSVKFVLRASNDQKMIRVALQQAEAGVKFKDGLMSVMSHELRTPLNAIIGFGQLIADQFETDQNNLYKEYADYIVEGGKRLLGSVSDMLLASDARSGPITISASDISLGELIENSVSYVEKAASAAGADIKVTIKDPDLEVYCDRQMLSRALAKLLDNSIKFSDNSVEISIAAALTPKGDLAILVKDNGPGISSEKLSDAVAPFSQSDMSLRRTREGLGLGLPLANAIAHAHNGSLKLDSKPGDGVRALILLPASRVRTAMGAQRAEKIA